MAGHSKWANIKFRKAAQDKKRGKVFTKLIREITIAARMGGEEADANPRLRQAIDKALTANMTKDTIARAIKRGVVGHEGSDIDEVRYEGYASGAVAVIVDCLTDNRNRTVGEVRHAFSKCGGHLGVDGSVSYLFAETGVISLAPGSNEEKIMEVALDGGATDIKTNTDGSIDVFTAPENFIRVRAALSAAGFELEAEMTMLPVTEVKLDKETAEKVLRLQDMLEDLDDVQNVYTNADISEEILTELSNG